MSNTKKVVSLIREIVKQEVQKEVKKILISEGAKAISNNINDVPEVLSKPVPKKSEVKEVSYTKNPTLNKILNETAQKDEFAEYPTMGGGTFDSTKMAQAIGYGNVLGDAESRRKMSAVQTAQSAGVDPNSPAVQDVMSNLTKDYSGVMKALKKRDGK
tara:strand:- start:789 stop:1262 length:474 start_codon:yes stop_codon:yes gene_type:complete